MAFFSQSKRETLFDQAQQKTTNLPGPGNYNAPSENQRSVTSLGANKSIKAVNHSTSKQSLDSFNLTRNDNPGKSRLINSCFRTWQLPDAAL